VMDDRVDEERRWVEVLKVLHDLRPEEQDVVALCDWSGLTYQETAEALNIPVGTVRSRLSRARRRLRERISPDNTLFGVPIVIN
jgi:RNA polymerase sigma-70 factor (ECF subfamily)